MRYVFLGLVANSLLFAANMKIMSFNILLGGNNLYPLETTLEVMRRVDADVLGVQEADSNGAEIATRLGYHWHPVAKGTRPGGILSRYPITQTFRQGAEISLPGGEKVYVFSVHLMSGPYQPYDIQEGKLKTEDAVIQAAKDARGAEIVEILSEMAPLIAAKKPVFLVGDFNEPSHLDWTGAAGPGGAKLHSMTIKWPTSSAVLEAGLRDSYRTLYPNEVSKKGYTWTPIDSAGEIHDRIDFIYFAGDKVRPDQVQIVGELGGPDVDIVGGLLYPSDHRGVVGRFSW